ncbi:iron-sulfur assembly protein IscA-like 2, mitochondrial isoform X2 [Glycine soja]|nr:iron-sulfur assembly protein IscA-like 2, mitochondrial isoform X2 [Glycine max]XP_028226025.1 iron-sulfur assembly protein IscA-like 2, mitochondrial isoform X2 [Glycine soja]|eukprot:XP_006577071.1 iron-sulfur assembly protein IscA-like 2, mitochondrial isoform X2 [Glycine max]
MVGCLERDTEVANSTPGAAIGDGAARLRLLHSLLLLLFTIATSSSDSDPDLEPLHMTKNCVRELEASESSADRKMLPLSVETGGCAGFQVFERDGIKLVVDNISYDFVKGATVDYVEELSSHSFLHRKLMEARLPTCDREKSSERTSY